MIDYATVSFPESERLAVIAAIGCNDWIITPGSRGYAEKMVCEIAGKAAAVILVGGSHHQRGREVVSLSGTWFGERGDSVLRVLLALNGARLTRVDLAYDDHDGDITWNHVYAAVTRDEFVGFRVVSDAGTLKGGRGRTVYFGRRGKDGNGRFVRIYDKAAQQNLPADEHWMRYELELCGDCARQFGEGWLVSEQPDSWISLCLVGGIDFREVRDEAHGHMERRERLAWWQKVVDKISGGGAIRICRKEKRRTIAEYSDNFLKAAARSWCLVQVALEAGYGGERRRDYFQAFKTAGLSVRQYRLLQSWIDTGEINEQAIRDGVRSVKAELGISA